MSSYVGEVLQTVPAAMSQVLWWNMRTRLYSETSLIRTLTGAIESVRIKRLEFRENKVFVARDDQNGMVASPALILRQGTSYITTW